MLYLAGTAHHRRCTGNMYVHMRNHRFPSGNGGFFLFFFFARVYPVLGMQTSVPLKNPHSAVNIPADLSIAWVALS